MEKRERSVDVSTFEEFSCFAEFGGFLELRNFYDFLS
jgi:hypothetical protein